MIAWHVISTLSFALAIWLLLIRPRWPWDWRGRRKSIRLSNRRKDWEE